MSLTVEVAASFTRPSDTTQYAVGDLVSTNTTAAACAAFIRAKPCGCGPVIPGGYSSSTVPSSENLIL